jgi:hypothetical protein
MFAIMLLALTASWAQEDRGPTWPDGATLQVAEAAPSGEATTDVQVSLSWPAAQDDSGVIGYWLYQQRTELARLDADTLTWSGSVPPYPPRLTVIAVDAAGNMSVGLSSLFEVSEANFAPPLTDIAASSGAGDAALGSLIQAGEAYEQPSADAAFYDASSPRARSGAAESSFPGAASVEEGPPNLSIRVGRQGEEGTLLDIQFEYLEDGRPSYYLRDGDRRMELQLSHEERGGGKLWRVELYAQPISRSSRLSRLTVRDPLGPESTGACVRDTDYEKTGGLWVEVGVDPKGGDPVGSCAGVED